MHFEGKVAIKYGVEGATMLHNLYIWIKKNKANKKHFYDGRYWTYNTQEAFSELFPFWTKRQIERILKNLEKEGAIYTGNYNKLKMDRTKWYSLSESVLEMYNEKVDCNSPNGEMEIRKPCNDISPNGDSNTIYNTNINTNNNISKDISCEKSQGRWKKVIDTWNELGINKLVSINPNTNREKMLKVRIRDYGLDEVLRAIKSIKESDFLMGRVNSFIITFDWFIRPNNFPKVLEGNYIDKRDSINEKDNKKPVDNRYGEVPKVIYDKEKLINKLKEERRKKIEKEQSVTRQQENTSKPKNLDELLKKIKL